TDAQTGSPISGAGVVTVIAGSGIIIASTQTDLNGNYIITGLSPGSYDVVFSANNFASQTSTVHLTPNEIEIVNAALTPNPATVSGRVVNVETSIPIANALIQAFTTEGTFVTSTLTDVDGQYTLTGLPEGTFTISASVTDFATQIQTVTLTPGETEIVNFALTSNPASLSGIVTDAQTGSPLAGALVQVFVVGTTIPVKSTLTDATGQYRISNLSVGTYNILFSSKDFIDQAVSITLVSNETKILDIALDPKFATITGVVLDAKTGIPLANILIEVFNNQGVLITSTLTGVNGQYKIFNLPAGKFTIKASSKDYFPESKTSTLTPGETEVINFTISRKMGLLPVIHIDPQQAHLLQRILNELLAINTNMASNRKIIINNSKDVIVSITDTDYSASIEIVLPILVILLIQLDIL
ncbi:carboxypeptidase regulatory-like domain-containing protein, partial [Priestia megaterium]|uniref:carboxypeptidase regulatory-like domain-containing protein n=1 Tax=Priestia megaterium TaxID=1404 RepID=UPI0030001C36